MSKNIIITGGTRGIGKAIVDKCIKKGCNVVFNYLSSATEANEIVKIIRNKGQKAWAFQADVSDFSQSKDFIKKAQEVFEDEIDGLVNNAGITRDRNLFLLPKEDWDAVINTNLTGYFNVTRNIITYFLKNKRGSIVNITSVSGLVGIGGQTNYCASKAGIIGFTRALAKEAARAGVPVNAVAPGYIETDMTAKIDEKHMKELRKMVPMRRFGQVNEVAETVWFLLSKKAPYITGQVITIDGGLIC